MSYNNKKLLAEIPDETHAAKFLQTVGNAFAWCEDASGREIPERAFGLTPPK